MYSVTFNSGKNKNKKYERHRQVNCISQDPWDTESLKASSKELIMQCQWTEFRQVPCLKIILRMQLMSTGAKMITYCIGGLRTSKPKHYSYDANKPMWPINESCTPPLFGCFLQRASVQEANTYTTMTTGTLYIQSCSPPLPGLGFHCSFLAECYSSSLLTSDTATH